MLREISKSESKMTTILEVTVGSLAHGLATPQSDLDVRYVYIESTKRILSLTSEPYAQTRELIHSGQDYFGWEIGAFLKQAIKNNPTVLEVMATSIVGFTTPLGDELRGLMPGLLSKKRVHDALKGFATSQRKDLCNELRFKAGGHYIRLLVNGIELLEGNPMTVNIGNMPLFGEFIRETRHGKKPLKEILSLGSELEKQLDKAYDVSPLPEKPDLTEANEFLLKVRKEYWENQAQSTSSYSKSS